MSTPWNIIKNAAGLLAFLSGYSYDYKGEDGVLRNSVFGIMDHERLSQAIDKMDDFADYDDAIKMFRAV